MPKMPTIPSSKADEAWKYILDVYFPAFMGFFFPDIAADIDWNAAFTMLDKELLALTTESMVGKRLVDKLVKVTTTSGEDRLIHLEIQGDYESAFAKRVFTYYYKLYEKYSWPIATLVIFTDDSPTWQAQDYQAPGWGYTALTFQFLTRKLLAYQGQEADLLAQNNPFGTIIVAQLAAIHTRGDPAARYERKLALTRHLYEKKLGRDDFYHHYYFIDHVLTLSKSFKLRYHEALKQFEKESNMPYLTTAEEIGIEKGEQAVLRRQLKRRFRDLSKAEEQAVEEKLAQADAETLLQWSENFVDAQTLPQVFEPH